MEGIEPKERSMKPSTKAIFRRHGLRLDRALHNWVYFVFYTPYVKAAYKAINLVERRLTGLPLVGFLAGAVFERYHSKVLSFEDAKKSFFWTRIWCLATTAQNGSSPTNTPTSWS
jgi:hypothetical protein